LWLKRATTTPPPAQPCGGRGKGGGYLYGPEDLLNENVSYTYIFIKSILKLTFLMKTSETKKFFKIFCEVFLILKNTLLMPPRTYFYFYKKGFLNSQVVRIRVKVKKKCIKMRTNGFWCLVLWHAGPYKSSGPAASQDAKPLV
jgi:hypothetical protein